MNLTFHFIFYLNVQKLPHVGGDLEVWKWLVFEPYEEVLTDFQILVFNFQILFFTFEYFKISGLYFQSFSLYFWFCELWCWVELRPSHFVSQHLDSRNKHWETTAGLIKQYANSNITVCTPGQWGSVFASVGPDTHLQNAAGPGNEAVADHGARNSGSLLVRKWKTKPHY